MALPRSPIAAALMLGSALVASPAVGAVPCSKSAVGKIVHLEGSQFISKIRCADVNGDGRRDVAWAKSGGGTGGNLWWGVVYQRKGRHKVARFSGYSRYHNLRIRRRKVLIDSPVYRADDPNGSPSGGTRTESATWNGSRFVKRLVAIES